MGQPADDILEPGSDLLFLVHRDVASIRSRKAVHHCVGRGDTAARLVRGLRTTGSPQVCGRRPLSVD